MEFDFPESHQPHARAPAIPPCSPHAFTPCASPLSPSLSITSHFALPLSREFLALPCCRESPSHPPGAKDHVSGILDSSAGRKSGEVVAENWNSVPYGRWSLPDRRA